MKRNQYRLSHVEKEIINKQVAELHALGLIEPAARDCKYASATVLPPKKDDAGNWTERRMCGDYRPINAKTPQDTYRMPMADEIFDELGTSNIFTTLDMLKGYNQIPIDPADRAKTAFYDGSSRLWQWTVMPFGLKNAGAEFQRCMDTTLYGLPRAKCYIDDVLVHAHHNLSSVAELKRHVDDVAATLDQTQDNGLRASPKKCRFGYFETPFLGHLLTGEGVAPLQSKVQAVQNIPQPKNVSDLRSFLGLANYYRRYVPNFSTIVQPMNALLKKDEPWHWSTDAEAAFCTIKARLTDASFLRRPDYNKPFIVHTDWSVKGMGAVLPAGRHG